MTFANKYAKKVEREEALSMSCKRCGGNGDVGTSNDGYLCFGCHDMALHQQGRHFYQLITSPRRQFNVIPTPEELGTGYTPKAQGMAVESVPDWMKVA